MSTTNLFLNPETKLLRSGWRALAFLFVLTLPQWIVDVFFKSNVQSGQTQTNAVFETSPAMIFTYLVLVAWVGLISWLCLRFLDRKSLRSLGFAFHANWWREVLQGFTVSALMMTLIIGIQGIVGNTKIGPNPIWINGNQSEIGLLLKDVLLALALLILAGAFEELAFRGYAFQTLLRGMTPVVPILLLSVYFGMGHWGNPSRTLFSTINTVLAGVWLAVAYLKTRSLWFPTALHFSWNWMMGAFFGLPVSGLRIPRQSIFESMIGSPSWLTGGAYGPEGGAAATVVILLSTFIIWRADWLNASPEMQTALSETVPAEDSAIRLDLQRE